jgi:hypothetical protein
MSGEWSGEDPAELVSWEDSDGAEETFTVGHGSTRQAHSREAKAMLRANEMVEIKQRGDSNCMFRSLSVAAGKSTEYHKELRRRVVERMRAEANTEGDNELFQLGAWGTSEALKVAAEEMQIRVNEITMDGSRESLLRYGE